VNNVAVRFIDRHVEGSLGSKRAFEFNGKPYSYHDLAALANRAGNLLKAQGVTPGARVAMLLPESPAYFATLIGAMKIGAVPVLVIEPQRFAAGAKTAQLAVVHSKFLEEASSPLPVDKTIVVGEAAEGHPSFVELMRGQPSSLAAHEVSPEATALVVDATTFSHRGIETELAKGPQGSLGRVGALLRALDSADTAVLS
jgi:acyl-CoA synthetase (AMP-forming)/AMP-acid ligase II